MDSRFLLFGHDTVECAYFLAPMGQSRLDFQHLAVEKESLRASKSRHPTALHLGSEEFLLATHGTGSGYPFLLENDSFSVQCGEFNKPNFFVTFRSFALWQFGAVALHKRFLKWAASVGLSPYRPESLSRVDFTFDYSIPSRDFDEDNFVTSFVADNRHRKNRQAQTFRFGAGQLLLRTYDKCAEISAQSAKTWFHDLWGGEQENVWRFEWQARKEWLRRFGIRTFIDLEERQGDLLRVLTHDHTSLRIKGADSNRSRWAMHPLWLDLQRRVADLGGLGIVREVDPVALLDERLTHIAISVYGHLKRIAAIEGLQKGRIEIGLQDSVNVLQQKLNRLHDPLSWGNDVERRMTEMRLGQW